MGRRVSSAVAAIVTAAATAGGLATCAPSSTSSSSGAGTKELFTASCSGCHTGGDLGPTLPRDGLDPVVAAEVIRDGRETTPGKQMPAFGSTLTPAQIDALAEYVSGTRLPSTVRRP
ncbi:MAG: cytochrome c [Acidimicrobiales bacterium]